MNLWSMIKLIGSAVAPRMIPWHGLATTGAMLICVAVALNVGPFAKPATSILADPNGVQPRRPPVQQASEPRSVSAVELEARTLLDIAHQAVDAANLGEAMTLSGDSSPVAAVEIVPPASQDNPVKDRAGDPTGKPPRDDADSVKPPPSHQANDVNSDVSKSAPVVGIWAPDPGTCSVREFRDGALPTVITADGAWAGETFCIFSNKKEMETGWSVLAKCSNPHERWATAVRLTVKDNRLKWTSKRGSQTYTRCLPDVLTAEAR